MGLVVPLIDPNAFKKVAILHPDVAMGLNEVGGLEVLRDSSRISLTGH